MISAGLAHEINNPLAAVTWNVEYALEALGDVDVPRGPMEALDEARKALGTMRDLVRHLRLFGRQERHATTAVDVVSVLDATLRLVRNELQHHARIVRELSPVPLVHASEALLGQVFVNLLVNAAHAIPQGASDRNRIVVGTSVEADGRVRIDVSDSGAGMTEEVRSRLFTPFFTTKPLGVGSGLGLALCRRILDAIGGEIRVESTLGVGSTFTVLLRPATTTSEATPTRTRGPAQPRKRVVFIDDDPGVVSALTRSLSSHHDVVGAASLEEAMEAIDARAPDAIVCDVMMPDMLGGALIEAVLARWPGLARRVILLTGGAFGEGARQLASERFGGVLEKPIAIADLAREIDELGDGRP